MQTEGEIPRERVLAAIGRKQGDKIETLAERDGIVERSIRNWLDMLEEEPIKQVPYDNSRPGGPSKLTADEREQLEEALQLPPTELGNEHQAWSSKLLLHYVKEDFDVKYTGSHARYLLHEAGVSWRTARPRNHEAGPEKPNSKRQWKKRPELSEKTVVVVDQFTKRVVTVQRRGWYPIGSNPTIDTSNSWKKVTVLGAVTDDGDSFYF